MNIVHRAEQPVDMRGLRFEREDIEWMKPLVNGLFWVSEKPILEVPVEKTSEPADTSIGVIEELGAAWDSAVAELHQVLMGYMPTDLVVHQTEVVYAACAEVTRSRHCQRVAEMIRNCVQTHKLDEFMNAEGNRIFKVDYSFVSRATRAGWYFRLRLEFNKG